MSERPAGIPPQREAPADREEAQLIDLLWEAQDLVNHGHDVSSADLRRTVSRPAPAFDDALRALDELQRSVPAAAAPLLQEGDRVGGCEIRGIIGRGGMGIVYEAIAPDGRCVALKVLSPAMLGDSVALLRFKREAAVASKLDHPHVVKVFDAGEQAGLLYFRMERVEGESLLARLERDRESGAERPDEAACREWAGRFARLADALEHAHRAGVVHRDVKPSNVLVEANGRLRLVDFGIARAAGTETLTATSAILGTPLYMAPEQALGRGREVGPAADIYGLAATLYERVTGGPLFDPSEGYAGLITRIVGEPPRAPRRLNPGVPRALETVLLRALEKAPESRYASAADLAADLDRVAARRPVRARRVGMVRRLGRRVRRQPLIAATLVGLVGTAALLTAIVLGTERSTLAEDASPPWIRLRQDAWIQLFASSNAPALREIEAAMARWSPASADEADEGRILRAWIALKRLDHAGALRLLAEPASFRSRRAARLLRAFVERAAWRFEVGRAEEKEARACPLGTRLDHVLEALFLFKQQGEHEAARELAAKLVSECPDYLPARILETELAKSAGDYEAALRACGTLLLMRPGDSTLLMLRASVHRDARKPEAAIRDYRAAIAADARNEEARIGLYYLLVSRSEPERTEAARLLEEGIELDPRSPWLLNARGWTRYLRGRHAEAVADFEAVLRSDPYHEYAQINLGNALLKLGREGDALAAWERMLADPGQPPANAAALLDERAAYEWQKGDREATFRDLRRALEICYRPRVQNNLAYYLIQSERYGEALDQLEHLLSLVPAHKEGMARRGKCRMLTFDLEGAKADLEKAAALWGRRMPDWARVDLLQVAGYLEGRDEVEARFRAALDVVKPGGFRLSLVLLFAGFLSEVPERSDEARELIARFRSDWRRHPGHEDERPWADELDVRISGREDGWAAAVAAWKRSGLPARKPDLAGGRFEPLRHQVAGAEAEADDPYRDLCRALLEGDRSRATARVSLLRAPAEPSAAWVVGQALLEVGRAEEAVPYLERAAGSLDLGEIRLDLALTLVRLGRSKDAAAALTRALHSALPQMHAINRLQELRISPDPLLRRALLRR